MIQFFLFFRLKKLKAQNISSDILWFCSISASTIVLLQNIFSHLVIFDFVLQFTFCYFTLLKSLSNEIQFLSQQSGILHHQNSQVNEMSTLGQNIDFLFTSFYAKNDIPFRNSMSRLMNSHWQTKVNQGSLYFVTTQRKEKQYIPF